MITETLNRPLVTDTVIPKARDLVTVPSVDTQELIKSFLAGEESTEQLDFFEGNLAEYAERNNFPIEEIPVGAVAILGLHNTMLKHMLHKPTFSTGETVAIMEWTLRQEHQQKGRSLKIGSYDLLKFLIESEHDKKIIDGNYNRGFSLY